MKQFILSRCGKDGWEHGQFVTRPSFTAGDWLVFYHCHSEIPWARFHGTTAEQKAAITAVALNQQLQFLRGEDGA